jgi:hypothetical protein
MRIGQDKKEIDQGSFPSGGLVDMIGVNNVVIGATNQDDVIGGISSGCCTLFLIGHRGGVAREGGIVTHPDPYADLMPPKNYVGILPDDVFERRLNHKFFGSARNGGNCCKDCVINLVTCGGDEGDNYAQGQIVRQQIADTTGCKVCGSRKQPPKLNNPILSPLYAGGWEFDCEEPGFVLPEEDDSLWRLE